MSPNAFALPFADRDAAGAALAQVFLSHREFAATDPVVAALPRGGVPVAAHVARAIHAPLDVIVVRKLGVPGHRELAMGALGEGGIRVLDDEVLQMWNVTSSECDEVEDQERLELSRRAERVRARRSRIPLDGRPVIVVDDGLATGSTAKAAIAVARDAGAIAVVVAAPVAPPSTVNDLAHRADAVVCVATPSPFAAIGQWYRDFSPTSDDDVVRILDEFSD